MWTNLIELYTEKIWEFVLKLFNNNMELEPSLFVELLIGFQFLFLAFQGVQSLVDIFQQFLDLLSFTLYGKVTTIN